MFARLFRRKRIDDGIGDELRAHIAQRAADIATTGVPLDDALRQARDEFGVLAAYEQRCRREQRLGAASRFSNGLLRDFVYAGRRLRATPLFTIFAVVSLAVGVGVTTAVFSIVREVFWKPSGVPHADRAAFLFGPPTYKGSASTWHSVLSREDFEEIRRTQTAFAQMAASAIFYQGLTDHRLADTIQGEAVSGTYFDTVRVGTVLGRSLMDSDDQQQASVAVLSHTYWRAKLDSDPHVIGRVIRIGGHPFEIVGVAAPSFDGITMVMPRFTSVWIPLRTASFFRLRASPVGRSGRDLRELSLVGRLGPDVSVERANAELSAIGRRLDQELPIRVRTFGTAADGWTPGWEPATRNWQVKTVAATHADLTGMAPRFGALVLLLVALVLLVACTNLANLTLARGFSRRNELVVRRALGASRWRLVREQAAEGAMLAVLGGLGALLVARTALSFVGQEFVLGQGAAVLLNTRLDLGALGAAGAAMLLSLAVFGMTPALQLTRGDLRGDATHLDGFAPAQSRSQRRVIRWQVAIACGFLVLSALAMQAVMKNARHDPGIDLDRLAISAVNFRVLRWDEERVRRVVAGIITEGRRQGSLETLAVSSGLPFGTTVTPGSRLIRHDQVFRRDGKDPWAATIVATPDIFRTLGVPLLKGRLFDERDAPGAPPVIVMSARSALDVFGTTDSIGRQVRFKIDTKPESADAGSATVIGIVGDTDIQHMTRRSNGGVYLPFAQHYEPGLTVVGRAKADPRKALHAVTAAIRAADPEIAIYRSGTGFTMLGGFYYTARVAASVAGTMGMLALMLSMIGLHGVLAQIVAMRTREVGLRIALGADRGQIHRMILYDGFRPVVQGMVVGLFLGTLARFVARAIVYPDLPVFDALTLIAIPVAVGIAGFLACHVPARRAARVDPNVALRAL